MDTVAQRSIVGHVRIVSNGCNDLDYEYDLSALGLGSGSRRMQRLFSLETAGYDCGVGETLTVSTSTVNDGSRVGAQSPFANAGVFAATVTSAMAVPLQINSGLNDAWYNPATNGQGFLITVFPDRTEMFLAWFTFDTERPPEDVGALLGEPGHRWLTAQRPYIGDTANLTIFVTEGGVFDAAEPAATTDPAGDGTL